MRKLALELTTNAATCKKRKPLFEWYMVDNVLKFTVLVFVSPPLMPSFSALSSKVRAVCANSNDE